MLHQANRSGTWAHPSLQVMGGSDSPRGFGLVAKSPIKANTVVVEVPEGALLNVFSALRSEYFSATARALLTDGLHSETVAMLFAIAERRQSEANPSRVSPWSALLTRVPHLERMQQLMVWPTEALSALGSQQVAEVVRESVLSLWDLSRTVCNSISALPETQAKSLGGPIGFDDLLWAKCLFDSRAVAAAIEVPHDFFCSSSPHIESEADEKPPMQWIMLPSAADTPNCAVQCPYRVASLAPVVDLLNHSAHGACTAPAFDNQRRCLSVSVAATVNQGTELCLCYGALQNWELLMYYGFCPASNPHDRLTLGISVPEDSSDMALRELMLQLHCVPTEHVLRPQECCVPAAKEGWAALGIIPPQLLRCLRIALAPDPQDIDLDLPPGASQTLSLDLQCLNVMEELFKELLESFKPIDASSSPLWFPIYGTAVSAFRQTQHELVANNCAAVSELREQLNRELPPDNS